MVEIQVYTYLNPRIVEVLDPADEITVQEVVDLIRDWEDKNTSMAYDPLIDAAGKENLGGGVTVGITATLQNAQLLFTGRTTCLETGVCTTSDPLGETLYATGGLFQTNSLYRGCTVFNATARAMAAVTSIESEIELKSFALSGGTRNTWLSTDTYAVYPNVQCAITGGNLVAVDAIGADISPVMQSPNVQVIRSSSSSATLMELDALQFSSFNGGVTLDITSFYSGTGFPNGTPQQPINNLSDAMLIANDRGFTVIYVIEDLTINSGASYVGMTFIGESVGKSAFTVDASADVTKCEFYEATLTGTLDGDNLAKDCQILDLNYVNGVIEVCMLGPGTITLGGSAEAHFLDCWCGTADGTSPVINMGGSGQDLAMRNYAGCMKITNLSSAQIVSIGLSAGDIELDSSITAGAISVSGIGHVTNNTTGTATVDLDRLLDKHTIADAIWDEARVDHENIGSFGAVSEWAGLGGGLTEEETAAAVWNALAVTYGAPGTMGWLQNLMASGIISVPKILPGE